MVGSRVVVVAMPPSAPLIKFTYSKTLGPEAAKGASGASKLDVLPHKIGQDLNTGNFNEVKFAILVRCLFTMELFVFIVGSIEKSERVCL